MSCAFPLWGLPDPSQHPDGKAIITNACAVLPAFCPQVCIATGDEPFRYLLYKDVNRHVPLEGFL